MSLVDCEAEIVRLAAAGIIAVPSVVVYGRTDADHLYTVRIVGYEAPSGGIVSR